MRGAGGLRRPPGHGALDPDAGPVHDDAPRGEYRCPEHQRQHDPEGEASIGVGGMDGGTRGRSGVSHGIIRVDDLAVLQWASSVVFSTSSLTNTVPGGHPRYRAVRQRLVVVPVTERTRTLRLRPTAVTGEFQFRQIEAGNAYTCGVTTADRAYCWGYGGYGQLGDGTTASARLQPRAVAGSRRFDHVNAGWTTPAASL